MTFAVSVAGATAQSALFPYFLIPSLLILIGSLAGLLITIEYSSKNIGKALPALPLQTFFMLVMWGISKFVGF